MSKNDFQVSISCAQWIIDTVVKTNGFDSHLRTVRARQVLVRAIDYDPPTIADA